MPDLPRKVGNHFTLADVVTSITASHKGIDNVTPLTDQFLANAVSLATRVLDPERDHWGAASIVSSWFRSPALNHAITGSSKTSQHMTAEACDHRIQGVSVVDQYNWLAFESGLPFDQVIYEFDSWVHVSFSSSHPPRRERLRIGADKQYREVLEPI